MDMKGVDPALIAAFIDVVKGHEAAKRASEVITLTGILWDEWLPWAKRNVKSARLYSSYGNNFRRTKVKLDADQPEVSLFELPWNLVTPKAGALYREVREATSNGRKGKDGKIGKVSGSTVNRELGAMHSMFEYFRTTKESIPHNPLEGFHRCDETRSARQTCLSPEQVRAFIAAGCPMWQDITTTAYRCAGMRHTEARLLRKSEIDWDAKVINLPGQRNKNGHPRVIPIPDDVEVILRQHCQISRGPFVFVDTRDPHRMRPVGGAAMQYWMEKARKASGVVGFDGEAVVIHSLRHAGVTRLVEAAAPESFIKAAAGMCEATFQRYVKWQRPQQEILRDHMNRIAPGPTPIMTVLHGDRKEPKKAPEDAIPTRRRGQTSDE
jgi:integrase